MSEPWFVYLLLCNQKTFYVGITPGPVGRFRQHKDKQSFFTKKFSDLRFVYSEKYPDKYGAANREKQLKGWSAAKKHALKVSERVIIKPGVNHWAESNSGWVKVIARPAWTKEDHILI